MSAACYCVPKTLDAKDRQSLLVQGFKLATYRTLVKCKSFGVGPQPGSAARMEETWRVHLNRGRCRHAHEIALE
eukprot:392252-Rhodomonas_salina.2